MQWAALRRLLERLDGAEHAHCLRLAVADALLAADHRLRLPLWLLAPFQVRNEPCIFSPVTYGMFKQKACKPFAATAGNFRRLKGSS